LDEIPFKSVLYPSIAYFGLAANLFLALVQGWTTLSPFDAGNFVDAYILLPLFGLIYIVCKIYWRSSDKFKRSWEIDLDSGRRTDLDDKGIVPEDGAYLARGKGSIWRKIWNSL
jgi:amino acid transporter